MTRLDEIRADIAAFADDDEDVIVDEAGTVLFVRGGEEIQCRVEVTSEDRTLVHVDSQTLSYRDFLVRFLGGLDAFAERLLAKRPPVQAFVDGPARLDALADTGVHGRAVQLLDSECSEPPPFASRVIFITADAGHGKTALLREYQARQAKRFLERSSGFLFWHLDLQGRQLLRLSEALMGDLGDLRVSGLWMAGIVRLLQHRALILAVDGFDELAAEQGSTDAIGALGLLVSQMGNQGTIVAAARRTFFDTDNYLRRAGVFRRAMPDACEFDEISLLPWTRTEATEFLGSYEESGRSFKSENQVYADIIGELGGDESHPMVSTPFLLSHIARGLLRYQKPASEFMRMMRAEDRLVGVGEVVEAFVKREVEEKWRYAETGEPYLTVEQHMRLLGDIAEEMYLSQKDRLDIEVIETIATLLLDEWSVDPSRRRQVLEMVKMHVLLTPPAEGERASRSFDHPEFRDYFFAVALRSHLARVLEGETVSELGRYLSVAQISDATARYVCGMLGLVPKTAASLTSRLEEAVQREWKPTYLQTNCGTLLPFVLSNQEFDEVVRFSGGAILSSVVLEHSRLTNVLLEGATFVNVSLADIVWRNVTLQTCQLGEIALDEATCNLSNVALDDCYVEGLRLHPADGEPIREYAPTRIRWRLSSLGFRFVDAPEVNVPVEEAESESYRETRRLLRLFYRTTFISDQLLELRFRRDHQFMTDKVIPLMVEHGILEERPWRGSGIHRAWAVRRPVEEVLAAEDGVGDAELVEFWNSLRNP